MSKKVVKKSSGENTTVEKLEERAAPSGIEWGGIAGSGYKQSRIGTYRTYKHTDTETTVTMQIWYWAGYAIDDTNNNFRYGWGTSANVNIGKKNIHTQNGGYPEANKIFIAEYSKKYTKTDKVQTGKFSTAFDNIEYGGGTGWRVSDFSIPALAKYTISYNANGGSGAPGTQYVLFGRTITLSSTKPTKAGAEFSHWNTNSLGTGTRYNPGQSYTVNSSNKGNITLYAIWNTNDYTITYDANGGANAPSNQTKKHGTDIILSSQKPTRQNYNFLGWASSSTSSIPIYQPGDTYNANASITLYAVWELGYTAPRITELTADRCNVNEAPDEEGTYAKVSFKWEADLYVNLIKIEWKSATNSYWESTQVDSSSNTISQKIGGNLDTETEYNVRVTVQDSNGKSQAETEISSIAFELDFLYKGGGVSIGKPATKKGFEVNYPTTFENTVVDQYGANMITGLAKEGTSEDPNTTLEHSIVTSLNTPNSEKMYVVTYFHGRKSTNDNRMQCAYPYRGEDTEYIRHYESGSWTNWKKVGGSTLTQEHFLTLENHKNVITVGNLRGGYIKNIHGVRYGNVVNLYVQINDITAGGGDVEIFRFKNSRYYPAMYGVHNGFISKENNVCYIGQFNDGHFTMSIPGGGIINSSSRAMVLITMTYITN